MSLSRKLKMAMAAVNINQIELAKMTDQAQPTLSQKMLTDNFKYSEYERLVKALGCTLRVEIVLPDGRVV